MNDSRYQIILRFDGITRFYFCECYFDAVVLMDCITMRYPAECVTLKEV